MTATAKKQPDMKTRALEILVAQPELRPAAKKVAQAFNREKLQAPDGHPYFTADIVMAMLAGVPVPPAPKSGTKLTEEAKGEQNVQG